jgi:hypothetical protein
MPRAVIRIGRPAPGATPKEPRRPQLPKQPELPLSLEALRDLDLELARLARANGAQRLRIGQALEELKRRSWHHELGFSSLGAYVIERCCQSARWGLEACALARKLADLPALRGALAGKTLSWSMVELVAPHATRDTESGLALEASRSTVRRMRELLRKGDAHTASADEDHAAVSITMSSGDAWLLEHTKWLFERIESRTNADQFVHWLVAEGLMSLAEVVPAGELAEMHARDDEFREKVAAWRAQRRAWREEAEARVEDRLELSPNQEPANEQEREPAWESYPTARALDAHIRGLCQELAARDLLFGALAERFWKSDGWRRRGFASETQYASERLGVSLSSIKTKRALARRTERMPSVTAAIERRAIGFEAALLVTRVATDKTIDAWLARAAERTIKLLRQEVDAAELRIRFGQCRDQLPPDQAELDAIKRQRQEAGRAMAAPDPKAPFAGRLLSVLSQMSGEPSGRSVRMGRDRVRHRFVVTRDTRELWDSFEDCFHAARPWLPQGTTLVQFLSVAFVTEWGHVLAKEVKFRGIYARDDQQCQSPVCMRRDKTPHHLVFRAHGGSDDPENVITLCVWCHLFAVHEGRIKARGPASEPRFELGRDPILVVEGRRKIEAGDAAAAAA